MSIFNKIFGTNSKEVNNNSNTQNNIKENDLSTTINSIYPYFKQFLPSRGASIDLPTNLNDIDRTKTYNIPSLKLVSRNICEDLNCLYAIDNNAGYEIIQENKLLELKITEEELHEIALANFRKLLSTNMKAHGDSNGLMFTVNGNLEAGLVLIDEIWDQVENQIGDQVVIAVPSRDVIVATGKSNRHMIDSFSEKAKSILESGDHPLSKNWFIRIDKKWQLFEPIVK